MLLLLFMMVGWLIHCSLPFFLPRAHTSHLVAFWLGQSLVGMPFADETNPLHLSVHELDRRVKTDEARPARQIRC